MYEPSREQEQRRRKPNPEKFALYDLKAARTEKAGDANGGDSNGSPPKKVTGVVERGEEGDAEAAVGHGVEQAMAGGGQE